MRGAESELKFRTFLSLLRATRKQAGLTQVELAKRLRITQSMVSKVERGERRLDVLELNAWCMALGTTLSAFAVELEKRL